MNAFLSTKTRILLLSSLFLISPLYSHRSDNFEMHEEREKDHALAFRVAYFYPTSKRVRDIYPHFIADFALEGTRVIGENAEVWAAVDVFSKKGCSLCFEEKSPTRITLIPISIGLKFVGHITDHLDGYVGAGVACSILRLHDEYPYVQQHINDTAAGAIFKTGLRYGWNTVFLELFGDYMYQKFDFGCCAPCNIVQHDLNISGFKVGLGLGVKF